MFPYRHSKRAPPEAAPVFTVTGKKIHIDPRGNTYWLMSSVAHGALLDCESTSYVMIDQAGRLSRNGQNNNQW